MNTQLKDKLQTKAFTKYFAFFAYSEKQLNEGRNINFDYLSLGGGLICPAIFCNKLVNRLSAIQAIAIAQVLATHTIKEIIWDELANHEAQITGNTDDTYNAVEQYGITRSQVCAEYVDYYNMCVDKGYF